MRHKIVTVVAAGALGLTGVALAGPALAAVGATGAASAVDDRVSKIKEALTGLVTDKTLTQADLLGKPALVNVWGTWCISCRVEHPVLNKLAEKGVVIYGINYKDDNAAALKWLAEFHNPYQLDIRDEDGNLGLNLGVYGAPETFFIDAKGVIRDKYVGVIDEVVWREQLAAKYQALVDEAKP